MVGLDVVITAERPQDGDAVRLLEQRAFGPGRYARTAYRLREGQGHDPALSFVARVGTLVVGAVRMSPIVVGDAPGALLGPLTVDPAFRGKGIGGRLIEAAAEAAARAGHSFILLVGDEPYYARHGFRRLAPGRVEMPGPVDPARLLACALDGGDVGRLAGPVRPGRP